MIYKYKFVYMIVFFSEEGILYVLAGILSSTL